MSCKPGEPVNLEVSGDATAGIPLVIKDADGNARTLAANERLLIDSLSGVAAATTTVTGGGNTYGSIGTGGNNIDGGDDGIAVELGVTPTVTGAGQVDLAGAGRIVKLSVGGTRPAWKEEKTA